ncbi:hypothetical protein GTR00_07880 [Kineococcus sp. T90]|nr:hypothetical protein [Kineococcus indalonis]
MRKFAAGMEVESSSPEEERSSPTGEFQAAVPPTAQPSAPGWAASMSPTAARPVSRVAGIDHSTRPVAASR